MLARTGRKGRTVGGGAGPSTGCPGFGWYSVFGVFCSWTPRDPDWLEALLTEMLLAFAFMVQRLLVLWLTNS